MKRAAAGGGAAREPPSSAEASARPGASSRTDRLLLLLGCCRGLLDGDGPASGDGEAWAQQVLMPRRGARDALQQATRRALLPDAVDPWTECMARQFMAECGGGKADGRAPPRRDI